MQPVTVKHRPTGVTILAVLDILGGILLLVAGIGAIAGSGYPQLQQYVSSANAGMILIAFGAVTLLLGVLALICGVGFWGGRRWAWTLGMAIAIIGIIWGVIQIVFGGFGSIIGVVFDVIIVYYLTRPHVKSFFGRGPMMTPTGPPTSPPPGQM